VGGMLVEVGTVVRVSVGTNGDAIVCVESGGSTCPVHETVTIKRIEIIMNPFFIE
jgi:hypothetical protein